jgi:hypothetical protein
LSPSFFCKFFFLNTFTCKIFIPCELGIGIHSSAEWNPSVAELLAIYVFCKFLFLKLLTCKIFIQSKLRLDGIY